MGDTAIGWTHRPGTRGRTWNPVRGCRRKSAGCQHCYAEVQAERIVRMGKGKPTPYDGLVRVVDGEARWTGEISIDAARLAEPLRWRQPSTIFVDSMSDLFYDKRPGEHIAAVFGVMAACPQHTFLILTKYADRMRAWFEWANPVGKALLERSATTGFPPHPRRLIEDAALRALNGVIETIPTWRDGAWPLLNAWIGVSTEDQDTYIERVRHLQFVPSAVHFISAEPLLGAIDMRADGINPAWLDWIIDGCESGPNARPAQRQWFASLEQQCRAAGVAYFHKQEMIDGKLVHDFPGRQEFPR